MLKFVHRFSDNKKLLMIKAKLGSVEPWGGGGPPQRTVAVMLKDTIKIQ